MGCTGGSGRKLAVGLAKGYCRIHTHTYTHINELYTHMYTHNCMMCIHVYTLLDASQSPVISLVFLAHQRKC